MKKFYLSILVLLLISSLSMAQTITGTVIDDKGKALAGASVALKKLKDSAVAKLAVTNSSGRYEFPSMQAGNYFIQVSFIGHEQKSSPSFEFNGNNNVTAPEVALNKSTGNLKEVTVVA